jgi:hypothetical protein
MSIEREVNAGYVITDRLTVGDAEFVIGQRDEAPSSFVTWKCRKGEKSYFWGHYMNNRLTALEDLCNRALEEIERLKCFQKDSAAIETIKESAHHKRHEPER